MGKNKVGRPTIISSEIIQKLEEVFSIGGTDLEACFYANISKSTLYNFQNKNPEFVERKEKLKEKPILKARQTIIKSLDDPNHAKWYLERKKKKEFGSSVDITSDNQPLQIVSLPEALKNKYADNADTATDSA